MPRDASNSRYSPELVDDVARQEVDVIVVERKVGVPDALSSQLVQLSFFNPNVTLGSL